MQQQILLQLQQMNKRLEELEQHKESKVNLKLSKPQCSVKLYGRGTVCHKSKESSSSDESDVLVIFKNFKEYSKTN